MNFKDNMAAIRTAIKNYITYEKTRTGGLLTDVETIIPISRHDDVLDPPCVWISQHPTIIAPDTRNNLSRKLTLQTTFEFICVVYDEDLEISDNAGQDLASRVLLSIMKNHNKEPDPDTGELVPSQNRLFTNIKFNTFYPVGEVQIEGKRDRVPATSVVLDFIHEIDWYNCQI